MKKRIAGQMYTLMQILILGLPLIAYMYVREYTIGFIVLGVIYADMIRRLLIVVDLTLMETSRLREYIEEGRVSQYIEEKNKNEVKKGNQKYREQVTIKESRTGLEITRASGFMWKGYRVKVENPLSIDIVETDGERLERVEGKLKINGGGYNRETGEARGILKIAGEIKVKEEGEYSVISLTKEGYLKLSYNPTDLEIEEMEYAVTYGPHLILDGERQELSEYSGVSPRTAIGQRADGVIIFLVVDGRMLESIGATMREVQKYMESQGCLNASLLDGGGSSQLVRSNNRINKGGKGRVVNNVFRVR